MADRIKLFCLGGLDETGKNMVVVEINGDIFIIECGFKYPDKTTPGIDYILPNPDYLKKNRSRIKAYLITHGHDESIGGLPLFYRDCPAPIYASSATLAAIQQRIMPLEFRPDYHFVVVEPSSVNHIAGREVVFFQTCHNMANSSGIAIWTDKGYIVYSGDFIVDYDTSNPSFRFDLPALGRISDKPVLLLMSESMGADKQGYCSPYHRFRPHIQKIFTEATGRIFIAAFWPNVYGLKEIVDLSIENHKKIAASDDLTRKVLKLMESMNVIHVPEANRIDYENILRSKEEDTVIIKLGTGKEVFDGCVALAEGRNEDRRLVLTPEDTFILAAPPSDNLEEEQTNAVDILYKTHCRVIYLTKRMACSMHARQDDLKLLLSLLKPKYYLPVRGTYSQMVDNAKLALGMELGLTHRDIFIFDNGDVLSIGEDSKAHISKDATIDAREIVIDGLGVGEVGDSILKERQRLGIDGIIVVSATISRKNGKMTSKPDCQMRGFVYSKEAEPLLKQVISVFTEELEAALKNRSFDNAAVTKDIQDKVAKAIRRSTHRTPAILPIIIETD